MVKKIASIILYSTSIISGIITAFMRDSANWWEVTKPFFTIWVISTALALSITYINQIRRITYPILVCISAWSYKHRLVMTRFTRNTHRIYKMKNRSYKELFEYTQDMFDIYLSALNQ